MDFNMNCFEVVSEALSLDLNIVTTSIYEKEITDQVDFRTLVNPKEKWEFNLERYTQVLQKDDAFLSNLSILDLLFNEGTRALTYLEKQKL